MNSSSEIDKQETAPLRPAIRIILWIFGIVLPAAALIIEALYHLFAGIFFDPLPTFFHGILIALVPLSVFLSLKLLTNPADHKLAAYSTKISLLNGLAAGVAGFYAIIFIPLTPMAIIAIIYFLFGLLALAPLSGFLSTLYCRFKLSRQFPGITKPFYSGLIAAFLLLLLFEMPTVITQVGIEMATAQDKATRHRGITLLRNFGSTEEMLRACYIRNDSWPGLAGLFLVNSRSSTPAYAREVFYRVTGEKFNRYPPPHTRPNFFDWDADQGMLDVGGKSPDLHLIQSRLDGSADADAALAYLEWTLEFQNNHQNRQLEARCIIQLPPGAVTTRATLWINGEPREAAFGGRGQVVEAYQKIVRQRRDPLLITSAGPDRILVQCFPIAPRGQQMKIRVGFTTPLQIDRPDEAKLPMPYISERNFNFSEDLSQSTWIESKQPFRATAGDDFSADRNGEYYVLRNQAAAVGSGDNAAVIASPGIIILKRSPEVTQSWSAQHRLADQAIVQEIYPLQQMQPQHLVLAIDGSAYMAARRAVLVELLRMIPEGCPVTLFLGGDTLTTLRSGSGTAGTLSLDEIVREIQDYPFIGGQDNVPALTAAWEAAIRTPGSSLLWLHGPQALTLTNPSALMQYFERGQQQPELCFYPLIPGSNALLKNFDRNFNFRQIPPTGNPVADLDRFIGQLFRRSDVYAFRRYQAGMKELVKLPGNLQKTSDHLTRLWAFDEIKSHITAREDSLARGLAIDYQLVTPVSGAVVLENMNQYREAGLEPVEPGTVPSIPEPETWALIIIVLLAFGWMWLRSRQGGPLWHLG